MSARRAFRVGAVVALGVALGAAPRRARAQSEGLSLSEILDLKRKGVSNRQILRAAGQYCVSFAVNDSAVATMVDAGGDSALVTGLRSACRAGAARLASSTLIDDQLTSGAVRAFTSADGLCTVQLEARGVRIDNRRRTGACVIGYPGEPLAGDVRIDLSVLPMSGGASAQLILGFGKSEGSWDQYAFSVTADGQVDLCRRTMSSCRALFSQPPAPDAAPMTFEAMHRLSVVLKGRAVAMLVDDRPRGEYVADDLVTGGLVLGVGPATSAIFSRLQARTVAATAASR